MLSFVSFKKPFLYLLFIAISLAAFDIKSTHARPHLSDVKKKMKKAKDKVKSGADAVEKKAKDGAQKVEKGAKKGLDKVGKAVKKALDKIIEAGNKALEPLGFSLTEIEEIFKQVPPTLKLVKALKNDPTNPKNIKKLRKSKGKKLVEDFVEGHCKSYQAVVGSMLPYVGNGVIKVCSTLTDVNNDIDKALLKAEQVDTLIAKSKKTKDSKKAHSESANDSKEDDESDEG